MRRCGLELVSAAAPVTGLLRLWTAVLTGVRCLCVVLMLQPVLRHGRWNRQRIVHGSTPPPGRIKRGARRTFQALMMLSCAFTDLLLVHGVMSPVLWGIRLHLLVAPPSEL